MEDRLYLECACGGPEHLISVQRDDGDVIINVQMSPYLPAWKRAWVAARYVLGLPTRCHWGDALLKADAAARLAEFVRPPPSASSEPAA